MVTSFQLTWAGYQLELGRRTCIMGIVNVTPDSFSDGGQFLDVDAAVAQCEKLITAGADIIDIGGESTRPFSEGVSEEEELRRVLPVIEKVAQRFTVPVSIDTTKAAVAARALDAGAAMINDVGAFRLDPEMAPLAAAAKVPVILMHMLGLPRNMQQSPHYDDPVKEIKAFLLERITWAQRQGIERTHIIIDPGIGFGKTVQDNLKLLNQLDAFHSLSVPILIGTSRKSFIRNTLKTALLQGQEPEQAAVIAGTQATTAAAILNGAHIVRVHDVAEARITAVMADAIKTAVTVQ
jgi:dihydropteroate synthase